MKEKIRKITAYSFVCLFSVFINFGVFFGTIAAGGEKAELPGDIAGMLLGGVFSYCAFSLFVFRISFPSKAHMAASMLSYGMFCVGSYLVCGYLFGALSVIGMIPAMLLCLFLLGIVQYWYLHRYVYRL